MIGQGGQMMSEWEAKQLSGSWDWTTFKEMLANTKRFGIFPSKLPQIISLSNEFKELCKSIQFEAPTYLEVGKMLYINMSNGKLMAGAMQFGTRNKISIEIDENISNNLINVGQIHRHPSEDFILTDMVKEFLIRPFLREELLFSTSDKDSGDIRSLMLSKNQVIQVIVYDTILAIMIKTSKTPRDKEYMGDIITGFFKNPLRFNATNLRRAQEVFGLEFFVTNDYNTIPLERLHT